MAGIPLKVAMAGIPLKGRLFLLATLLAGALAFLENLSPLPGNADQWLVFVLLVVFTATSALFPVVIPRNQSYELTSVFVFAAVFLVPSGGISLLVPLAFAAGWLRTRKPWHILTFNISIYLLQAFAARAAYISFAANPRDFGAEPVNLVAATFAACLFAAINHLLLAVAQHLVRGHSWTDTRLFGLDYYFIDVALACTGSVVAALWRNDPLQVVLVCAPLFLIQRALNTPNLQEQARTDDKSGLYNPKHFQQAFEGELARALRFGRPLSVVVADLDLLRNINNTYGHLAGDAVIKGVADIIRGTLREHDVPSRFGGDEFAILLPETGPEQARTVAERLRREVEEARFTVTTSLEPIRASISLGTGSSPDDGCTTEELLHQADLAVYLSKLKGRNRVSTRRNGNGSWDLSQGESQSPALEPSNMREVEPQQVALSLPLSPSRGPSRLESSGPMEAGTQTGCPGENGAESAPESARLPEAGTTPRTRWMDGLTWPVALLVCATVVAFSALWAIVRPWDATLDWPGVAILLLMTAGAQGLAIDVYGRGRVSTSAATIMAGCMIFGLPGALIMAPVVPLTVWIRSRGLLYRALFDLSDTTLSAAAATLVYQRIAIMLPDSNMLLLLAPAVASALTYYLVNVGLISVAIGLSEGRPPLEVWYEKFRWLPLHYMVFGVLALLMALAYQSIQLYGLLSFFVPTVMIRYSMKQYIDHTEKSVTELRRVNKELMDARDKLVDTLRELRETYHATLTALSAALDSRDTETEGHSQRVVRYAAILADQLGLAEKEKTDLLNGALLHDVGKIGVPDSILRKPGPLTSAELERMKEHPQQGYAMLKHINFLKDALLVVRYHHERYDGLGYPARLAGDEIPLNARVFTVVDSFDAMTSERPYRPACSVEEALAELVRCAGSQFDPAVVDALLRIGASELARLCEQPRPPNVENAVKRRANPAPRLRVVAAAAEPAI